MNHLNKNDLSSLTLGMAMSFLPFFPSNKNFPRLEINSDYITKNIELSSIKNIFDTKDLYEFNFQDTTSLEKTISVDSLDVSHKKKVFNSLDELFFEYQDVMLNINDKNVPVLMFHELNRNENRYSISPNNFRFILEELYKKDFYALSLKEFYESDFSNVPVNKKPLLITFDDATKGQFDYVNDSIMDKDCAVSIMDNFYSDNPDFGKGAVFFISYGSKNNFRFPFGCEESLNKKLVYLVENGYDIGWHTPLHPNNWDASKNNVLEQKVMLDALLNLHLGKYYFDENLIRVYAHPFGAKPSNNEVYGFLKDQYDIVMDAWGGHSKHPLNPSFNVKAIPRIEMHVKNLGLVTNIDSYIVEERDKEFYTYFKQLKD